MESFENYELKKHTTFKIGGCAKKAYFPQTVDEFVELLENLQNPIILGACSNVLISSDGLDKDVIITTEMKNFSIDGDIVNAQCGVRVPLLSRAAQKAGLSGFEYMVGFPGSVGGVVCMNASAHKQSVSDTCFEAVVYDLDLKKVLTLNKDDLNFSYRHSVLCEKNYIVLEANFKLNALDHEIINERMQSNITFRKEKQPNLATPNAGSIFKNPKNDSAGRLLEAAGAKDLQEGGAQVWEGHANFILNTDDATSKDVSQLMNKMYNMVKEKFAVELEPEVRYFGNAGTEEEKLWDMMLKRKSM